LFVYHVCHLLFNLSLARPHGTHVHFIFLLASSCFVLDGTYVVDSEGFC
jgi:hypothetical protein